MLIIFGGLPGSGKSTIAQALAQRLQATYLRVDTIEQAIRLSNSMAAGADVGSAGYVALYRIAADNLELGQTVIADTVNRIEITRAAFRKTATDAQRAFLEIEISCSDPELHRHRAETRQSTIEGHISPTWKDIQARTFEPWNADLRIDTAVLSVEESVARIMDVIRYRLGAVE
ncbi:AAA family ATPase [Agrobacterium rubi]|uniref:AAA family ATPase n=1 Tax=Agrobacterium rubi TaxID=28099 RepID=A0AAE7QZ08_9HYPH|nr:AAA family ATPase [Agrobacterium rubi]NTE86370.1 AAA family ATPase [Agrobacterium rubi]NTF02302.1 AAA family ATPase [Agrobacterium rubi]NTF36546.1 AAA family ATPase [Agrobacterium rubi]OCJ55800.1 kinase [Agrobacterium rubi]QTF99009.1 AAA family ATPase [Agrobacterium rubi]